jgi:hypothetical protein
MLYGLRTSCFIQRQTSLGSSQHSPRSMPELPTIALDTTVAELYRRASPKHAGKRIGQVLCGVNSGMWLSPQFPRNIKFLYQDSSFNTLPHHQLTEDNHELQSSLAMKYLSLIPQRDAFISGDTAVVLFNIGQSPEQIEHDKREAEKTIGVLEASQRPELLFCPGPGHIPLRENNIDMVACKVVLDALNDYPMTCDLETHWFLNSKEGLACSGLPTPRCDIIQLDGYCPEARTCCHDCKSGDPLFVPPQCSGSRGEWLNKSTDHVISALKSRKLPFVLKNQQTFGGAGTYFVSGERERDRLVEDLSGGLLRKLFSQVTADNHHLKPGTVLLSDMVADPIGDYGLTFFVTEDGDAIFLAVSEQMIDSNRAWVGSTINYTHQESLQERFSPIMLEIAAWLHKYGYFGPTGADILETAPVDSESTDSTASFHIVDLNVRTSGSICLPLLRGHFLKRGFSCGSSFTITVKATRDEFVKQWRAEFESGRMCILSWYEDWSAGTSSIADVAVGGEDESRLHEEMKKVRDTTDEVTF